MNAMPFLFNQFLFITPLINKQGRKRPLDTPKRMIERMIKRREREGERNVEA